MTLDQLQAEWKKDGPLDHSRLDEAACNVALLHGKYWQFSLEARARDKLNEGAVAPDATRANAKLSRVRRDAIHEPGKLSADVLDTSVRRAGQGPSR